MMKYFLPAATFAGRKDGYVFKSDDFGVGYYKDQVGGKTSQPAQQDVDGLGKRKRDVAEDAPQPSKPITSSSSSKADTNIIDELLDESEAAAVTQLDASSLKQMLGSFEKKITKNQKLRMKHSDEPEKFMESECELHAELEALHLVAAYPELYPVLLASNCLPSILGMITHENTDISIAAVSLLQEMLDSEDSQAPEQLQQLVDAFVAQHGLELITQNLLRLNESNDDDAQGVHNTLSILDSLLELDDAYANLLVTQTGTLSYLMKRINTKAYDANKLYATEVLSIIIQKASKEADRVIGAQDGLLEELLQAVAIHRKKDMKLAEEVECMENIFLCLGTLLLRPSSRAIFLKLEGMELLLRCLQAQEAAAFAALPALSSALLQHAEGCQRFVDVGGLKFIFSYLLLVCAGDATHKHRRTISSKQRSLEESLVSSIAQLCTQLDGEHAARLASKLVEGEHAKLAVCCRLFAKYAGFLHKADQDMQRVRQRLEQEGDDEALEELMDPDSIYIERLDNGLFVMQQLAVIMAFAGRMRPTAFPSMQAGLSSAGMGLGDVLVTLRELAMSLHEEEDEANARDRALYTQWAAIMAAHAEGNGTNGV